MTDYFATVPPQEILPIVNARFESSVKGIYVIGDVTGVPLVKIAANQGVDVIAKMQAGGVFQNDENDERLDLVIVGGGPAGLSAAIEAQKLGLRYVVLERDKLASTVRSFPPGKKVYAEPQFIENASELDVSEDLERDEFLRRLNQRVTEKAINVKEEAEVRVVKKHGERDFDVETEDGKTFPARTVLVAIGRQGQPRLLEAPGADNDDKVSYRLHTPEDYGDQDVLIVGGGNSAIEAALMLMDDNRVAISYRGTDFYRAKAENRDLIEDALREGKLTVFYESQVTRIRDDAVELDVGGERTTIANDAVIVQIGTLPPIRFLQDMGLELDGLWTPKRIVYSVIGLLVGVFIYFGAKYFVLTPDAAGEGKWLIPGLQSAAPYLPIGFFHFMTTAVLPALWLCALAVKLVNDRLEARGRPKIAPFPQAKMWLACGAALIAISHVLSNTFTVDPANAGAGPYFLPGFAWLFEVTPKYFSNLYGFYYLLYFTAITGFGLYWAFRARSGIIWRRNITIIVTQWTLWWGIPTFLAVILGRNVWTPLFAKSINAWPLNMAAFDVSPAVGPGDPAWWHTVAVVGVVWAAVLTFIVIPVVTIRWGKIYCSYICSCGALAETVGNSFRHRGPKGDTPRKWERAGFIFIALASIATIADLFGFQTPLGVYNVWVGTVLAGAVAIGMYPFLGQRVWCRMWCPLAFWMNFWGRWSQFKITPEKGKCIDCNVCNQYCQMGIDIKSRALKGEPVTLVDTPCVGCAECVVRCPMEILHLGDGPQKKLVEIEV